MAGNSEFERGHDGPALDEIQRVGRAHQTSRPQQLGGGSEGGDGPNRPQQREAHRVTHLDECERRVGAGDLDVDGGMIEALQDAFPLGAGGEMVGGGAGKDRHHAEGIYAQADRRCGREQLSGNGHHPCRRQQAERNARHMDAAIGDQLGSRVLRRFAEHGISDGATVLGDEMVRRSAKRKCTAARHGRTMPR